MVILLYSLVGKAKLGGSLGRKQTKVSTKGVLLYQHVCHPLGAQKRRACQLDVQEKQYSGICDECQCFSGSKNKNTRYDNNQYQKPQKSLQITRMFLDL